MTTTGVAIIGVLLAVIAVVGRPRPGTDAVARPTTASSIPTPTGSGQSGRYLTDLAPRAGGGNIQRVGAHSLRIACGSGESGDRYREVEYAVPETAPHSLTRVPGDRWFRTTAQASGTRDSRAEVDVLLDGVRVAQSLVTTGSTARLEAALNGGGRLALRVTCDPGAVAVLFTDPALDA